MKLQVADQYRINTCYVYIRTALDILDTITNKDSTLESAQRDMCKLENTLHYYVGPANKEETRWTT